MSRRERFRSHHRVPLTWEVPTLTVLGGAMLLLATPLAVQGLASLLADGRFAWPTGREVEALRGIVKSQYGVGLDARARASLPPSAMLLVITALCEVGVAIALGLGCRLAFRAGDLHGLASSQEASAALGERSLRRRARTIRPDLISRRRDQPPTRSGERP